MSFLKDVINIFFIHKKLTIDNFTRMNNQYLKIFCGTRHFFKNNFENSLIILKIIYKAENYFVKIVFWLSLS